MRVENPTARAFYEIEAVRDGWVSRELERQVSSLLFERLAKSRNKERVLASPSPRRDFKSKGREK